MYSKVIHRESVYVGVYASCVFDRVVACLYGSTSMHVMQGLTWTRSMGHVSLLPWSYWLMLGFD